MKEKKYKISIPIFASENKAEINFDNYNETEIINWLIDKFNTYNTAKPKSVYTYKGSKRTKTISKIKPITEIDDKILDKFTLLIKVTTKIDFNNFKVLDSDNKVKSTVVDSDKIENENCYGLIKPIVTTRSDKIFLKYYLYIYNDPRNNTDDINHTFKFLFKDILKLKIESVKLDDILKQLSQNKNLLNKITINYQHQYLGENTKDFFTESISRRICSRISLLENFIDVHASDAIKLIKGNRLPKVFEQIVNKKSNIERTITVKNPHANYKIKQELVHLKDKITKACESTFNLQIPINEHSLEPEKLYSEEFILSIFKDIGNKYNLF